MDIANVIALLGGISLFLFGMLVMGNGLKKVAGNQLETVLYKLSSTPLKGVLLGTGVTTVIQSSSATSVMVVGFVNAGMMKVKQAIGVVLGAILGTSITGWIICLSNVGEGGASWVRLLSTSSLTGMVAVAGIVLRMFCKNSAKQHVGDILLGFAVLMTGMTAMSAAVSPLKESQLFLQTLVSFKNPLLGILVGCAITCVLQSASATIGILQALSVTDAITFDIALPIIMGIAIGAAVPVLLSALSANVSGKRVAFVYLIIDVLGVVIWGTLFYTVNLFAHFPIMGKTMGMVGVSLINTIFRLAIVLVLAPMMNTLEKIVAFLFKEKQDDTAETEEIARLDERFVGHPTIAIEQGNIAVYSMAKKAQENLSRSIRLFDVFSKELYDSIAAKEQVIDKYEDKLGTFLVKLTRSELSKEQSHDVFKILHTIGDIERIADHAVNLSNTAKEITEKKLVLSKKACDELRVLTEAVEEIVENTFAAFTAGSIAKAKKIEPLEQVIDMLCDTIKANHILRVQSGNCSLEHGFVFNDILTNYERIADHCSNIAAAMIEIDHDNFDTHAYLYGLKTEYGSQFVEAYTAYSQKYALENVQ
ncbi:MAG: Na/Pi cotransporter family protein [Clostridia bacterium]|nr:Na/Pi cotransporter family protein [Clostridia bacterium]